VAGVSVAATSSNDARLGRVAMIDYRAVGGDGACDDAEHDWKQTHEGGIEWECQRCLATTIASKHPDTFIPIEPDEYTEAEHVATDAEIAEWPTMESWDLKTYDHRIKALAARVRAERQARKQVQGVLVAIEKLARKGRE